MLIGVRFSPTQVLFLAENWMRDTALFVLRNRKLKLLVDETLPTLLCELNFIVQQIFNVHHEQEIVQIFTHTKFTNLTSLTSWLY